MNAVLGKKLFEPDYILLSDLTLPTGDGTTQIDHIVLSRYGIFVIETKNMSGWIFGGAAQRRWTQVVWRRKSQFQNPLRQNHLHLKIVQNLLGLETDQLENLVAFVGTATPKTPMPPHVFWSSRVLLKYISSRRIVRFTQTEVHDFARTLRNTALDANRITRSAHIRHLREKHHKVPTEGAKHLVSPRQ